MSLRQARWIVVLGGAHILSGCATVPPLADISAASSSFSYSGGRGVQSYSASPSTVIAAIDQALGDLSLTRVRTIQNGTVVRVEARTADNRQLIATVRSFQGHTQVGVRAGWFGDEPLSKALLNRVAVRLGSAPPEAIPAETPSAPAANPFFSRSAVSDEEMYRDMAEAPYRDRVIP